jgi:hypothetical protein
MSGRFAVLLKDIEHFNMVKAARIYARVTRTPLVDASSRMRTCAGVIAQSLGEPEAPRLAGELTTAGMGAIAIPTAHLVEFPKVELCHRGSITEDGLILETSELSEGRRATKRFRIIGQNIMLITAGLVKERKKIQKTEVKREVTAYTRYGPIISNVPKTVTKYREEYKHYLDICAIEPTSHCRIDAGKFNFRNFGLGIAPTRFENFAKLAGWLKSIAEQAYIDKSIQWVLDGDPKTNLKAPSLEAYENHIFWATQMAYLPPPS